jgi:hypothetical protein
MDTDFRRYFPFRRNSAIWPKQRLEHVFVCGFAQGVCPAHIEPLA